MRLAIFHRDQPYILWTILRNRFSNITDFWEEKYKEIEKLNKNLSFQV